MSGHPIFAPKTEGKPYPHGPNKPGAKYFLPCSNVGYAFPMAQLLPISLEIIALSGNPAWIALHAIRGDILSGSLSRESLFQDVPSSSSSWSRLVKVWSHADLVWCINAFLSSLPSSPAVDDNLLRICSATNLASPQIPTDIFFAKPILSELISTWIIFASFGQ